MEQLSSSLLKLSFIGIIALLMIGFFTYAGSLRNNPIVSLLVVGAALVVQVLARLRFELGFGTLFFMDVLLGGTPLLLMLYALLSYLEEFSTKLFYPNYFFKNLEAHIRAFKHCGASSGRAVENEIGLSKIEIYCINDTR